MNERRTFSLAQAIYVATRSWVPPNRTTGNVGETKNVLELTGVRKGEEGGINGHTNRNIASQCAGKVYNHAPLLFWTLCFVVKRRYWFGIIVSPQNSRQNPRYEPWNNK